MKKCLLIACCLCWTSLFGQTLSKEQVVEDLVFLKKAIQEYNPALDAYNPDFTTQSDQLIATVNGEMSLLQYYSLVSRLCAFSNEGHFNLGDWEDEVHKGILDNTYSYMPIAVRIVAGKLYVIKDYTKEGVFEKYDEILSINQQPVAQILDQLYAHLPTDGNIHSYAERKVSNGFWWMYYFYVGQPSSFEIQYRRSGEGVEKEVKVQAINRAERKENYLQRYAEEAKQAKKEESIDDFYEFEIKEDYAYLKLKSFSRRLIEKYDLKAKQFYKKLFSEIKAKKLKHLIIDLRNNNGGRKEFSQEVVPFILQADKDDFLQKTVSWKGKERKYKFPKKNSDAFDGQIYILSNGRTYSNAATFLRYAKEYGNAIVIGEEAGTRYEGFAAGSSQDVYLPHSNIKIGIPRYHIYFPKSKKQMTSNKGALPDVPVNASIEDYMAEKDVILEKALEMIKKAE